MQTAEQASKMGVEIWRDVRDYEEKYQVSNLGRVKSLVGSHGEPREKILKPGLNSHKYRTVNLCKYGNRKTHKVHRLVLGAFKRARYVGQNECRHLNGIQTDNRLFNLEFGTKEENEADKITHGTDSHGARNNKVKLTEEQVLEIRRLYATGAYYHHELGKMFCVAKGTIGSIINRKRWSHVG